MRAAEQFEASSRLFLICSSTPAILNCSTIWGDKSGRSTTVAIILNCGPQPPSAALILAMPKDNHQGLSPSQRQLDSGQCTAHDIQNPPQIVEFCQRTLLPIRPPSAQETYSRYDWKLL